MLHIYDSVYKPEEKLTAYALYDVDSFTVHQRASSVPNWDCWRLRSKWYKNAGIPSGTGNNILEFELRTIYYYFI